MTNQRILQIIREETDHQEGLLFEGMTYTPGNGYRNNQLIEVPGPNGKELITEEAIDTFQRVLDWAGFIPVIGDALDGLNALIYFLRKKFMDGIFSVVAIIPGVGSVLSKPLRAIYDKIGKPIVDVFQTLTKNGKLAATKFFDIIKKGSTWLKGKAKPIIEGIQSKAGEIAKWIGSINMKAFNKKILDYSYGWFAFPQWAITGIDGLLKQFKAFFAHMATPPPSVVHVSQKKVERTVHGLLPHEEEKIVEKYNDGTVNKKDYPTVDDFIKAQVKLRKDKEKEDIELKLWSKGPNVEKLQKALGIKVDGNFGEGTELAVKKYQKKNGLVQDGVVGPDTWAKIT